MTHIHGRAGYLFIHNKELGKTYHVSWGSVTSIDGQKVADIPKQKSATEPAASDDPNRKADQPKEKPSSEPQGPIVASYPAQANAWKALRPPP